MQHQVGHFDHTGARGDEHDRRAPPDVARDDMPPQVTTWRPVPLPRLPFASTVVFSQDDPYCAPERAAAFAQAWGSGLVSAGPRGHLNADSGLGDWPEGLALLHALAEAPR